MGRKRKININGQDVDATSVPFRAGMEHWNEYLLDDQSVVRVKLVVTEIVRLEGKYDEQGNPVYVVYSTNVTHVSPPEDSDTGDDLP